MNINSINGSNFTLSPLRLSNPRSSNVDYNVPSTVVRLGNNSPKIGYGIDAYRSVQALDSIPLNSDIQNVLISLMFMQLLMELL